MPVYVEAEGAKPDTNLIGRNTGAAWQLRGFEKVGNQRSGLIEIGDR